MGKTIFVVESLNDWPFATVDAELVHVDDYLTDPRYHRQRRLFVINLCRNYRYQGVGYYCSLLAEARRHRILPSVGSMLDLSKKALYRLEFEDLDQLVAKAMAGHAEEGDSLSFDLFFGHSEIEALAGPSRQIFERFSVPLLRVTLKRRQHWQIDSLRPLYLRQLDAAQREHFLSAWDRFRLKRSRSGKGRITVRYDMAILHNPQERQPPSDPQALQQLIKAGQKLGIAVELIEKRDYGRLAEYDALFIRETTNINHHTYRFARKAQSEGMVVIDDPRSIQLCTNKVYLAELLRANGVATPKTVIVGQPDLLAAERALGFPMVLKVPDGSFSQGVFKVEESGELREVASRLFKHSELLLAQEFFYTDFDWRIGILNRQPLYASQYFMSKKHWQIVHYGEGGEVHEGGAKTLPIDAVPEQVVQTALKVANLIGDGLYGVDLKQRDGGVVVIEVNDNPNIEAGVEDAYLKKGLYDSIMAEFLRRLELRHGR